jgi:hypothetical protein
MLFRRLWTNPASDILPQYTPRSIKTGHGAPLYLASKTGSSVTKQRVCASTRLATAPHSTSQARREAVRLSNACVLARGVDALRYTHNVIVLGRVAVRELDNLHSDGLASLLQHATVHLQHQHHHTPRPLRRQPQRTTRTRFDIRASPRSPHEKGTESKRASATQPSGHFEVNRELQESVEVHTGARKACCGWGVLEWLCVSRAHAPCRTTLLRSSCRAQFDPLATGGRPASPPQPRARTCRVCPR